MKIYNLKCEENDDIVKLSVTVESEEIGSKELWFATPKQYSDYLCKTHMDAFVVGLLYPAMQYGEDIIIDGLVSKKLLFNINNYVIPLLMSYSDTAKNISVSAENVTSERFDCIGVGTGFTGGVDSFCTTYDHYEKEKDPEIRINSFLFLNVGSHGQEQDIAKSKFEKRYNYLSRFPNELGLDFIPLDSNLHCFHPWGHAESHTLTSTSGVLAMQNYFRKYYYSSAGLDYRDMIRYASTYREKALGAYCDPILLPLLSTETTEFISDGLAYTRTDKLLNIISYEPTYRFLNVCVSGDDTHKNCSACSKCLRTLLALDLSGNLEGYSDLFDIKKYKKLKTGFLYKQVVATNTDPFAKANIDLAKRNKIKTPSYFVSSLYCNLRYDSRKLAVKAAKGIAPNIVKKLQKTLR